MGPVVPTHFTHVFLFHVLAFLMVGSGAQQGKQVISQMHECSQVAVPFL